MFFNIRKRAAVPAPAPSDNARGLKFEGNGPDTPAIDVSAMRRALDHAAWRDPKQEKRKGDDILKAIRTLERTAACVDLASERLADAADALTQGKSSREAMMRGLLTARFEELIDSLERVAIMAQNGPINLLAGNGDQAPNHHATTSYAPAQNSLSLSIGATGFRYVLSPIDIRRGVTGLNIPCLESGFDDEAETYGVETALIQAQAKLKQFGDRLAQDAVMLVSISNVHDALNTTETAT